MPLLLYGARQVGKTYALLTFGKTQYKNCVYFNFEDSHDLTRIFERDLNPDRIIRELSAKCGQTILKGDTLVIFDEIQACERALTSLKYFCENAPEYHIAAAGSLLGVALNRKQYSFPVGKVDMLTLYPLDFEEFLLAAGQDALAALIREAYANYSPLSLHDTAMDLYKTYLVVGGMPAAVSKYIRTHDFDFVLTTQKALNDAYIADMAKYASAQETTKIMAAWRSVPAQLAKENHKFQYKLIKTGARAYDYETPLAWLETAGMIHKCVRVSEGKLPLSAYADPSAFKVYMMDTGLLCSKFDIAANVVLNSPHSCRRRPMLAGNRRANLSITPSEDGEEATGSNGEKSGAKASLPAKPHEALMSLPSVALSSSWVKAQYQVSPSITCCTILSSIIVLRFW